MTKVNLNKTTDADIVAALGTCINLSARIRYLVGLGWTYYKTAQYLTVYEQKVHGRDKIVRPQHVRNVATQPLKKS